MTTNEWNVPEPFDAHPWDYFTPSPGPISFSARRAIINHTMDFMQRLSDDLSQSVPSVVRSLNSISSIIKLERAYELFAKESGESIVCCNYCGQRVADSFILSDENSCNYFCPHCVYENSHSHSWRYRTTTFHAPEDDDDCDGLLDCSSSPIDEIGVEYLSGPGERVTESTRFFGCEIEFVCEDRSGYNDIIETHYTKQVGIYKSDGSLPYLGAEFCTLPMTRWSVTHDLKPVLTYMVDKGARAWNRSMCGLHIHVSRASAPWSTWGKTDRFFLNEANQAFLTKVAGREPNSYCGRRGVTDPATVKVKMAKQKAENGYDRYVALNFSTNKPTVEFRMFRGNVAHQGVMRAVEFCDAIIEFAGTQSNTAPMHYREFLGWLKGYSKVYPNLARLLFGVRVSRKAIAEDLVETLENAA